MIECIHHPGRPVYVRNICRSCYRRGGLPRVTRAAADTTEAVLILHRRTTDLDSIAHWLGIQPTSVVRALERHRARCTDPDPRLDRVLYDLRRQLCAKRWANMTEEQRARKYAQRRRKVAA